ncbi:MAG: ComEC/Rec2 family competence protein [Bacteroidales bacterium]|nr:ComEC/Rec2 family competence protein [Bacteroidales bacterium]
MWGEKYLCAFLAGNIFCFAASSIFSVNIPNPLISIFILITISLYLQFKQKLLKFNIYLTLAIVALSGIANGLRCRGNEISGTNVYTSNYNSRLAEIKGKITGRYIARSSQIIKNGEDLSTIIAITIGNKMLLSKETKDAYRNSGAMHLLALSGLHAGIIYGFLETLLFLFDFSYSSRQIKFFLSSIIIFIYAAIAGFSPSITRAAIMITLHKAFKIWLRRRGKWTTWLCSANIILLFTPNAISEIGFQLSFAAVAGIIALYPTIKASYWGPKWLYPVWNLLSISIACQITTLPIALYHFNTSSYIYLITNLFAIPLVTLSVYTFAIAYITFDIPYLSAATSAIAESAVRILNIIVEYLGT